MPWSREKHIKYEKEIRKKAFLLFSIEKEKQGCAMCGYSKCGACLDYHHVNEKSFRISAKAFYYMTPRTLEELHKCILLCKNCHYELHYKEGELE